MRFATILLVSSLTILGSCSSNPSSEIYIEQKPAFDLYNFFEGNVTAWAIVQNRKGEVVQRFKADIEGSIDNEELTLDETFTYFQGDGLEKRIWKIRKDSETQDFVGNADDVAGPATGTIYGNALNWRYEMDLTVSSGTYRVQFDDWMWMIDQHTLVNRAYIKKFGFVMAEVTLFMQKN